MERKIVPFFIMNTIELLNKFKKLKCLTCSTDLKYKSYKEDEEKFTCHHCDYDILFYQNGSAGFWLNHNNFIIDYYNSTMISMEFQNRIDLKIPLTNLKIDFENLIPFFKQLEQYQIWL